MTLSAIGSNDPDGDDLVYRWWVYNEAGTYKGEVPISWPDTAKTVVSIPKNAQSGDQIHVILEVRDNEQEMASPESDDCIPLTDYRRLVLNVAR